MIEKRDKIEKIKDKIGGNMRGLFLAIITVHIILFGLMGTVYAQTEEDCPNVDPNSWPTIVTAVAYTSINGNEITYLVDTVNKPGASIKELCVYPTPGFSGVDNDLTPLYPNWQIDHPDSQPYFGFLAKGSTPQLPLDGQTNIQIGKAAYSSLPSNEVLVFHLTDLDECGSSGTCWRRSSRGPLPTPSPTPIDNPPTQPLCPVAIATGPTNISLSWQASTDDIGISGYRIYRSLDGTSFTVIATVTDINYVDSGLTTGVTYYYAIEAFDTSNQPSIPSDTVYATPRDINPPIITVPGDMTVEAESAIGTVVTFSATATDDIDPSVDVTCNPSSGYTFPLGYTTVTCTATDNTGNKGSDVFSIRVVDTIAPTAPSGLAATAISSTRIDLSWTASYDAVGVTQYRIYRSLDGVNFTSIAGISGTQTTFSNIGLSPSTKYYYYVVAYDRAGHFSDNSNTADTTTFPVATPTPTPTDTEPGPTPTEPTPTPTPITDNPPIITVPADIILEATSPNGAIATFSASAYDYEDAEDKTVTCNPVSGSTFPLGTTIVTCTAQDNAGNIGSATFLIRVVDTTPPTTPSGLTATAISDTRIDLSWTASTDIVGVYRYKIYRSLDGISFKALGTTSMTTLSNTGLNPNTTYYYYVIAYDKDGNPSGASNIASAKTLPQPPNPPSPTPGPTVTETSTPTPTPTPTPEPCTPTSNTPIGENVETNPIQELTVQFDAVLACGETTAVAYYENQWTPIPSYKSVLFYNIETSATYDNYITIQVTYSDSNIPSDVDEDTIRLFHYENGNWVDVTVALDTTSNILTGRVSSLSPFGIGGIGNSVSGGTGTITVKGQSSDIIGLIILSISLIIISLSRLKIKE